jgi:hypothetical protein
MDAEERLREHIRRALSNSGIDRQEDPALASEAEQQVLDLFNRYLSAREDERETVYREGEERLLNTIGHSLQEKRRLAGGVKRNFPRSRVR